MGNDQLNDFIASAHERDLKFTDTLARIQQAQEDMNGRLFGGPNQRGALDYIVAKVEESSKESIRQIKAVEERTDVLESWRGTSRAWLAGAVAVLGLEGTALGLYFSKIASHVAALQAIHK
jgi:hypothetical protein